MNREPICSKCEYFEKPVCRKVPLFELADSDSDPFTVKNINNWNATRIDYPDFQVPLDCEYILEHAVNG